MNNLHLTLSSFKNESRLQKQTSSLSQSKLFDKIYVAALSSDTKTYQDKLDNKVSVTCFGLKTKRLGNNFVFLVFRFVELFFKTFWEFKDKNIDIINVHTLTLLPTGYILKKLFGAKLIYDTHELETKRHGLTGVRCFFSVWSERILIRKVDMILVVSESIADWYADAYKIERPTIVFNSPLLAEKKLNNRIFHNKFDLEDDVIVFIYQGLLTSGRGIDNIVKVFKNSPVKKSVVVFMGYGPKEQELKKLANECDNIFFHEAVSPKVLLDYTASADFGLCLGENVCLSYDYSMPNKLFEYIMAGVPPFVSNLKDMSEFVTKNKIGYVMDENARSLLETADLMVRDKLSERCREVAKEVCWENQEKKMLIAYEKLLN